MKDRGMELGLQRGLTRLRWGLAVVVLSAASACGYTLQSSKNELLQRSGVRSVYISPVLNNTYKAGVENLVYNQLLRSISAGRRLRLAEKPEYADAVLEVEVNEAMYIPAGTTTADNIFPRGQYGNIPIGSKAILVATEYTASLICNFRLLRQGGGRFYPQTGGLGPTTPVATTPAGGAPAATVSPRPVPMFKGKEVLWASSFQRTKPFPGNNQLGVFGTTSPLINESEFDRALFDLAASMMGDVNESMLAMF